MSRRDDEYYDRDERRSSHKNNGEVRKSTRDNRYRDDYEDYDDYDDYDPYGGYGSYENWALKEAYDGDPSNMWNTD
jgi:hypothetical protein